MKQAIKQVLCITLNPAIDLTMTLATLTLGVVNRATSSELGAAGKGLNVAHVLSELGVNGVATGFLGRDNDEIFEHLFTSHQDFKSVDGVGCMTNRFIKVAGKTRTNVKLVDGGRTTDINGEGFGVTASDKQALFELLPSLVQTADAVLVAGSLPQGFSGQDFDELLTLLTRLHNKVAVDVSGEALKITLKHRLWLIKPNQHELSQAFNRPISTLSQQLLAIDGIAGDIEHILVSMGEAGVYWFKKTASGRLIYQATPPTMRVVSTVGAGDTMVAGMIFGLLNGLSDVQLLTKATALSAYAVSVVGVKVPNSIELGQLMDKTLVQSVG